MTFPFPLNPRNGQQVSYTNSKGRLMVATYSSVKNEWEVETALPPSNIITSTPEFNVLPTADQQSVVWDQLQGKWVAKLLTYKTKDLTDVESTVDPTNNQILKWNAGRQLYEPSDLPGGEVLQATSDQVGVQVGTTDADKVAAIYTVLKPTGTAKQGDVLLVSKGTVVANQGSVGSWYYTGTVWVLGASIGNGGTPKPTINYRGSTATPQVPGALAGDLDVVSEVNNAQINVYDGANYAAVLTEIGIKQWIAAGSLFQGTLPNKTVLGTTLPTPAANNKGFYWTWTGAASTALVPADFSNGGGFTTTLQVGDWIQSDGTKYVHVPSDLMSKLRWEGVGSFKTWADQSWETQTLVFHNGKLYRSQQAIVTGDVAPDAVGSKWSNITPTYNIGDLLNVDTTNVAAALPYLKYNSLTTKFESSGINLDDLANVKADTKADTTALADKDILSYNAADTTWKVNSPAAVAKAGIKFGDLQDARFTPLVDGHFLVYDGANNVWKNTPTVRASVEFLSDVGDVEINAIPDQGDGIAWNGSKWVPNKFGGMGEWKNTVSYPQNSLVLHKNNIWLATASVPAGVEPNTPITTTTVTLATQRSNANFGAVVPGNTSLNTFTGGVPGAWNVGDFYAWTCSETLPYTVPSGFLAGTVITSATGFLVVVDKDGTDGWLGVLGWQLVQNAVKPATVTTSVGGLATNPWKQELNITVEALADVDHARLPANGETLVFNTTKNIWEYSLPASNLAGLTDVTITAPVNGHGLVYENNKWVNKAAAAAVTVADTFLVGTVQQSILTEPQFKAQLSVTDQAKWCLADGRDVSGSKYAQITSRTTVPDLRGAYLRMAGQNAGNTAWNGGTLANFQEDSTARPKNGFSGTTGTDGSHRHMEGGQHWHQTDIPWGGGTAANGVTGAWRNEAGWLHPWTSTEGAHAHNVVINGGGDTETRPKTYSVNYYIRIN